ncbi:translocator protein homolog [Cynara cardunculus var. scolymus]|uniref:TspO/MBR-related protein n=1 Tax=Cynara cardunculus var. scolymus TaxID=59895 RepID=A0A103XPE2_CYNCS|nr:translocator protein homolog [Cynara cardunculus var. scolymus]KVH94478.1 TspO/MBR-related protein [Cynara cardunculus var. scolymus]
MTYNVTRTRSQKKPSTAGGGVRSLATAIAVPVALTLADIMWYGGGQAYKDLDLPFWMPSLWVLHLTCLSTAFVMGLSAWLVWAESGFHRTPSAIVMYLAQLGFSLAWNPIFFKMDAIRVALAVNLAQMATIFSCSHMFGRLNPIAGDLVKLCLVWTGYLTVVNLYFVL